MFSVCLFLSKAPAPSAFFPGGRGGALEVCFLAGEGGTRLACGLARGGGKGLRRGWGGGGRGLARGRERAGLGSSQGEAGGGVVVLKKEKQRVGHLGKGESVCRYARMNKKERTGDKEQ